MQPGKERGHPYKAAIALFVAFMPMVLLIPTRALAHKVNVFAWVEGDTVFVEGYYSGKKRAQHSMVEVFNKAGAKLLEGRTNEKGEFSFKRPEETEIRIVLTAGMGHKNDFLLQASDFGLEISSPPTSTPKPQMTTSDSPVAAWEPHQLEEIIDKSLDRELAPVIKLIRDTRREGPRFSEILGGIGYIFGLFGVAIYFNNRKRRKQSGARSQSQ